MKSYSNFSASLVCLALTLGSAAWGQTIFSDEFNSPALNTNLWTFVNPLGDGAQALTGGQLSISVPAGTAHDAYDGTNNAPRIMQSAKNVDFQIEAKFTSPMSSQFQATGVIVQEDPANYLRFDFNSDGLSTRIFAASILNNVGSAQSGFNDSIAAKGSAPLYIRVKRAGNSWTLSYSLNDTLWIDHITFTYDLQVSAVGLFAGNAGGSPPAHIGVVDYFHGPLPAQPFQVSPANGILNQPTSLSLSWRKFPTATSYRLQVATDSNFVTGVVVNDPSLVDTSLVVSGLANSAKYYWRVNAKNTEGTSGFSTIRNFTTVVPPPGIPTPVSPPNNATDRPISLSLVWTKPAFASSYRLQVATDSTFVTGLVVNDSTLVDTSRVVSGLTNLTKYFWRVNAKSSGGTSAFSSISRFTTVVSPADAPALVGPANNTTNLPGNVTFIWRKSATATSYRLQIGTDSTFGSGISYNDSTLIDTTKTVTGLAYSTRYFWRVNAKGPGGTGPYSVVSSFSTSLPPPVLLSPGNNAGGQPLTITLIWSKIAKAASFRLQLGTDSSFVSGLIKDDSTIVDTFRIVSGLTINTRYYWRVSAKDAGGRGPFSPLWSFVAMTPLPDQVTVLSPADLASMAGSVKFVWRQSQPLVNHYWFEYAPDSLFVFRVVDSTLTDTTKTLDQLLVNTKYFWRVRAGNPGGWGPYSDVRRFFILATGVVESRGLPEAFGLSQNYPNPFNPSTVIEFALPKETRVTLEVYNLLGQRVATLVDGLKPAGYYTERFDGSRLSSGVYFYRFTSTEISFLKKMLLVK